MPSTLDPETRELMQDVKTQLAEGNKVKAAVADLETRLSNVANNVEEKLAAVRNAAYCPDTGRYRGICFGNEAEARSFGLYVMSKCGGDARAASALKSEFKDIAQRALGDSPDADGLVPIEFSNRIQRLVEQFGVVARNAFRMPMSSDSLTFSRRKTGLKVFKTGRGQTAEESEQSFATINLNAEEHNVLTSYPKAMGDDAAVEIGELIAMDIAQAFAESLDNNGLNGDGSEDSLDVIGITTRLKTINGVDNGGGLVLASGNAWSEITQEDILTLIGQARYVNAGKFFCSNEFFWQVLAKLVLASGGITLGDVTGGPSLQAFGVPVEITPALPRSEGNSQIPLLYGDMRLSTTHGVRQDLTIEQDTSVHFLKRQVAVLGTQRHDIANHTLGDDTTAGPMVGLITDAS